MKCAKCGTKNDKNDKFCLNCGNELKSETNTEPKKEVVEKSKKSKFNIKILLICLFVLIASTIAVYFIFFSYKTYSIDELYDITIDGVDGYGILEIKPKSSFDKAAIEKLVENTVITPSKVENLSNDDVITFVVEYPEELSKQERVKINKDYKYTVENLEEGELLDLFEDLKFTYSNKSPFVKISLSNEKLDVDKYNITYKIESLKQGKSNYYIKNGFFENGEKIKVTATYNKEQISKDGYIIAVTEKEYEIKGHDKYIEDKSELTEEYITTLKSRLQEEANKTITADEIEYAVCLGNLMCNYSTFERNADPKLIQLFFGEKTDVQSGASYDSNHTTIIGTYKVSWGQFANGKKEYVYCNVNINDFYIKADGTLSDSVSGDRMHCYRASTSARNNLTQNYRDNYRYNLKEIEMD